jgi:hypothetical protein
LLTIPYIPITRHEKEVLDITALWYSLKFGYTDTESFSTAYSHSLQHGIAQLSIVMQ